ncbi:hypothetical protein QUF74_01905 [Candidatus Halobeggiatoa sp. HSG11]|nr:hypothetical protein [Candidatus Halobeggiatoa sp. HSG11]
MRVILETEVFTSQKIKQLDLIALIKFGIDERHLIQVKFPDSVEVHDWLNKQSDGIREECELSFDSGYRLDSDGYGKFSPFTIKVGCVKEPQWNQKEPFLPLDIALEFLTQPFVIFVENRRNDSAFLRATATGWRKQELEKLLKKEWVKFEAGGGMGEILKYAEEIAEYPKKYLRHFVLFDSDAKKPKMIDKKSQKVNQFCEEKFIAHHQLKRREIENYLPIFALREWTKLPNKEPKDSRIKKVKAFEELSLKQRHHFDIKKGFQGDFKADKKEMSQEKEYQLVGDFYQNVSIEVRDILVKGFGGNIAELFKEKDFLIKEEWLHKDKSLTLELNTMLERLLSLT